MKEYEIELYADICCDECNAVIGYHFECPICGKWEDSGIYCETWELNDDDRTINCRKCGSIFELKGEWSDEIFTHVNEKEES